MDALIITSYTSGAVERVLNNISKSVENGWRQIKAKFKRSRNKNKESKMANDKNENKNETNAISDEEQKK